MNPDEPWREPVDAEGPKRNREIMGDWLNLGVSGFRCDMAAGAIEDDPDLVETGKLWGEMRAWLDENHPDAVLISEWGDPAVSVPAGFYGDFFMQVGVPETVRRGGRRGQDDPYFREPVRSRSTPAGIRWPSRSMTSGCPLRIRSRTAVCASTGAS